MRLIPSGLEAMKTAFRAELQNITKLSLYRGFEGWNPPENISNTTSSIESNGIVPTKMSAEFRTSAGHSLGVVRVVLHLAHAPSPLFLNCALDARYGWKSGRRAEPQDSRARASPRSDWTRSGKRAPLEFEHQWNNSCPLTRTPTFSQTRENNRGKGVMAASGVPHSSHVRTDKSNPSLRRAGFGSIRARTHGAAGGDHRSFSLIPQRRCKTAVHHERAQRSGLKGPKGLRGGKTRCRGTCRRESCRPR